MRILRLMGMVVVAFGLVMGQGAGQKKGESKSAAKVPSVIDINTATVEELKAIPGIGEVDSAKIVRGRPFQRKDELVQRGILPQAVYDKVKDRIVARQK